MDITTKCPACQAGISITHGESWACLWCKGPVCAACYWSHSLTKHPVQVDPSKAPKKRK